MKLILYGKDNCSLCDQAMVILELLQQDYSFEFDTINIYNDEELLEKYHLMIPVITYRDTIIDKGLVDMETIENYLKSKNPRK
ncbi:glutaredoxin family protein [Gracilibacillus boraciitolerans JCM 21714]|uniref:Glutaredoxin family protein n=1 Tax=Gracilibacillus boraciitolerans JCM 21714 TaxID=1298598 RepID=W4VHA5_9BACI|nr:glutaredoxin family protein [Gracilibacillus boraciitolerans]GAE92780.1 glutaredoxin family protein [Gracilibacillus boraciitolerans JCM 21714]